MQQFAKILTIFLRINWPNLVQFKRVLMFCLGIGWLPHAFIYAAGLRIIATIAVRTVRFTNSQVRLFMS